MSDGDWKCASWTGWLKNQLGFEHSLAEDRGGRLMDDREKREAAGIVIEALERLAKIVAKEVIGESGKQGDLVERVDRQVEGEGQRLYSTVEAASYLGSAGSPFSPKTLERWRVAGGGPVFLQYGRVRGRVYYNKADLDTWLESRRRVSTSDDGTVLTGE